MASILPTFAEALRIYSCVTDTHKIFDTREFTIIFFYESDSRDVCSVDPQLWAILYSYILVRTRRKVKEEAGRQEGERKKEENRCTIRFIFAIMRPEMVSGGPRERKRGR